MLRGANVSDQVPDVMFRGVTTEQPNYAEFIHRDVDTWCAPSSCVVLGCQGAEQRPILGVSEHFADRVRILFYTTR